MKHLPAALLLSTALTLSACGEAGKQWLDPDKTFALFDQPEVKTVNDTQEDMAKEAAAAGDYARAGQFYQQLVASQKGTPEQVLRYKIGLAEATRRVGDNEAAFAMFDELHTQNPTSLDIAEGRGLTLMATGKTVEAGRAFAEILEKDGKRWRTLNALGILFVSKSMIPEALAYYKEALANSPDNAAVLNNVGLSYAVDRNFPRAIEVLQQASRVTKLPALRKQIEMNLAMVLGVSGDMDKAREVASRYIEGAALDNNLGLYAHLAKDTNLAKTYLNMALSQSPTFYERAWENLDLVGDTVRGDEPPPAKPKASISLPKVEKLEQPTVAPPPASEKKSKARSSKKNKKTADAAPSALENQGQGTAEQSKPEAATPVFEMPKAVMIPEIKASAVPSDKPAGLMVGPSE